mgnify:CR=1 FL=1
MYPEFYFKNLYINNKFLIFALIFDLKETICFYWIFRSSTPNLDSKSKINKKENKRETLKRESPLPLQESSLDVPKRKKRPKLDSTFETETQYMQKVEIKVLLDYFNYIFFLIMDYLWLHISIYSGENS